MKKEITRLQQRVSGYKHQEPDRPTIFQITVPKECVRAVGWKKGDYINFRINKDRLIMEKV